MDQSNIISSKTACNCGINAGTAIFLSFVYSKFKTVQEQSSVHLDSFDITSKL